MIRTQPYRPGADVDLRKVQIGNDAVGRGLGRWTPATATAPTTTARGTLEPRAQPAIPTCWRCALGQSGHFVRPRCSRQAYRCCWGATSSAAHSGATTTPTARTTR